METLKPEATAGLSMFESSNMNINICPQNLSKLQILFLHHMIIVFLLIRALPSFHANKGGPLLFAA